MELWHAKVGRNLSTKTVRDPDERNRKLNILYGKDDGRRSFKELNDPDIMRKDRLDLMARTIVDKVESNNPNASADELEKLVNQYLATTPLTGDSYWEGDLSAKKKFFNESIPNALGKNTTKSVKSSNKFSRSMKHGALYHSFDGVMYEVKTK